MAGDWWWVIWACIRVDGEGIEPLNTGSAAREWEGIRPAALGVQNAGSAGRASIVERMFLVVKGFCEQMFAATWPEHRDRDVPLSACSFGVGGLSNVVTRWR